MFILERFFMVELFYFSSLDLMIKVEYVEETDCLRYASHREMGNEEKTMTEQYLMGAVTPKIDYSSELPIRFVYLGIDRRLQKKLELFHRENDLKILRRKEKEITDSVNHLIQVSMRNYYTEKIGELIISARRELQAGRQYEAKRANLKQPMNELLSAYNVYAEQKVTLDKIIPVELKSFWPGLKEARCDMVP
jgi:hypothetical protein